MNPIYLDHAATTPTDPRVVEAMLPYFTEYYGNPSSTHRFGHQAGTTVDQARQTIDDILNCTPNEIIFTSCAAVLLTAWCSACESSTQRRSLSR